MDIKVYEGYKKTSTSGKTTASKSAAAKKTTTTTTKSASSKTTSSKPDAKPASKTTTQKPRLAMFIDVDNAGISRENLMEILLFTSGKYKIVQCKLYGFSDDTLPGIRDLATEYNMTTVGKMKFKLSDNCLDPRVLIDAYECAVNNKDQIDMIFVWCYPCDLSELFEKIVDLGVSTATIDKEIFDCKNKFVSQTFKLYSPYDFDSTYQSYGAVRNNPSAIAPKANIEPNIDAAPTPAPAPETTSTPNTTPTPTPTQTSDATAPQPAMIDGVVPPVLPRRSIPERSNPNASKPQPETNIEESNQSDEGATSLVEEIARKLNIPMPSRDEISSEIERFESESASHQSASFMDMLKQAGFADLVEENKTLKYEDTIGDL